MLTKGPIFRFVTVFLPKAWDTEHRMSAVVQVEVRGMKAVLYLDELLLTNFVLGALLLLGAGLLAGRSCTAGRLLAGSAAAAVVSLGLLLPRLPPGLALLYKGVTGAVTVAAAYGGAGGRSLARLWGWYTLLNLLLGGAVLLPGAQSANLCLYLPLSPGRLCLCCGAVYGVLRGLVYCFGRVQGRSFGAVLQLPGGAVPVQAFCDTGFAVQDPLTGRGVVLVYYPAVRHALPGALRQYLDRHFAGDAAPPPPGLGVRLVPCTTIAGACLLPTVSGMALQAGARRAAGFAAAFCCPDTPPPWTVLMGPELAAALTTERRMFA